MILILNPDVSAESETFRQLSAYLAQIPGITTRVHQVVGAQQTVTEIYLIGDMFFAGQRPAVDVGISVSRVGGNAQIKAMKSIAGRLRMDLAQYRGNASDIIRKTTSYILRLLGAGSWHQS